jgi:hypothetical protein
MRRPGRRAACAAGFGATGAAALIAAACAFTPLAAAADAPPKSAADCRAISDFNARGACWDSLDKATQKETQDAQEAKKHGFGLGLHLPTGSAIKQRKEDLAAEEKRDKEETKSQTLTLASVENTPLGRLLLTSDEGAVWEQTDSDPVNSTPEPGDTVKVSKGMMGGYLCQLSRWQSVRCQRDR